MLAGELQERTFSVYHGQAPRLSQLEHSPERAHREQAPRYRGAMEVGRGTTTTVQPGPPKINLINIVEAEDYVPGVVANESIASFTIAALRAQAVAARGYAIANIGNYVNRGYPFDMVTRAHCQVYRGIISEHVNAVRAASDTYGLVASSNGRIIFAMYSGHRTRMRIHREDDPPVRRGDEAVGVARCPYNIDVLAR